MTSKYRVEAYENGEIPEPRWLARGDFDSPEAAVACAEAVIDRSLAAIFHEGRSAESLELAYLCFGEVPSIFNDHGLRFDPYAYVHRRIRELTGEADWQPRPMRR